MSHEVDFICTGHGVRVSSYHIDFLSFGYLPGVDVLGPISFVSRFLRNTKLFSDIAMAIYTPTNHGQRSDFSTAYQSVAS